MNTPPQPNRAEIEAAETALAEFDPAKFAAQMDQVHQQLHETLKKMDQVLGEILGEVPIEELELEAR
jgi:predicted outer membrane protein